MKIELNWTEPVPLKSVQPAGYDFESVQEGLQNAPGIYVFARKFGDTYTPIYIGKAGNVARRLKGQFNNLKLMKQVNNWNPTDPDDASKRVTGTRVLFVGYLERPRVADSVKAALRLAERSVIEHALSEGFSIVNIQMTRTRYNEVQSRGSRKALAFCPSIMLSKGK
ncbi:hypothetical protein [Cupriavidus pauculus]|uniref:hypothetical protein n=1 Tax=Cupriavidus pauculus TaxID=82633 RepID=UPI001D0C6009|nr:hypothetical protein [Cupriavidus pauculus]